MHWPKALKQSPHDLGAAMAHLKGLDHAVQQSILDEIVFTEHHAGRQVKNHVGLVRSLSNLARQGKFVAEGAHKVAQLRADRLAYEAAQRAASPPPPAQTQFVKAAEDSEGRKKVKETLARLKRRAVG